MLSNEMFNLFYEGAQRDGMIWTLYQYAERKGLVTDEDEEGYLEDPVIKQHGTAIEEVLTYEISIYIFRRLPGAWGEVIDNLRWMRSNKINEYRDTTGYSINTENDYE